MKRFLKYPQEVPLIFAVDIPSDERRRIIARAAAWRVLYTSATAGSTILADKIVASHFGHVRVDFFPWLFIALFALTGSIFTTKAAGYRSVDKVCAELNESGDGWRRDPDRICRIASADCLVQVASLILFYAGLASFLNIAFFPDRIQERPLASVDSDILFFYGLAAFQIALLAGNRLIWRYPEFMVIANALKVVSGEGAKRFRISPFDPIGPRRKNIFLLARSCEQVALKLERAVSRNAIVAPAVMMRAGAAELLRFIAGRDSLDANTPKRLDRDLKYLVALTIDTPSRSFYDKVALDWRVFDQNGAPSRAHGARATKRVQDFLLKYGQSSAATLQFVVQGSLAASVVLLIVVGKVDPADFIKTFLK
ncbi:hypothetical protein [Micromonospora lupini]|nr:hypothetical protein [Micromonospora lupini]